MTDTAQQPPWNAADKASSLRTYAEWLHGIAVQTFLKDKTHCQILFLFTDAGMASVNPVPAGTEPEQLLAGVRKAVLANNLYGVIAISECWTYMPKRPGDHVAIQLTHGEMRVSDLKAGDRTEALMLRMESRDGAHVTWLEPILRSGADVTLGGGMVLGREKCLKLEGFFDAV